MTAMMDEKKKMEISVVLPCLNEAETLKTCITKALRCLKDHGLNGEVLVVDNGSTDGSQSIATGCGARVIDQPIRGYGAALHKGFEEARGEYIVMGDADDSYDFANVYRFVEKLREGYDIVMGTRLKGTIKPGAMPWLHQYVGNPVLTCILNVLYQAGISDAHCGLRGFRKDTILSLDLRTPGMEFASEMIIKAARARVKMTEIPITLSPAGRSRRPHLRTFRDGWRHLRFMLLMAPDVLFIWPGIIIGLLAFLVQLSIWLLGPLVIRGINFAENTMIACMVITLIAFQILYLGVFAHLFIYFKDYRLRDRITNFILKFSKFETGIIVGSLLILIGLGGDLSVYYQWHSTGWGDLGREAIRGFIFYSTVLIFGVQAICSAFLLHMIGVDRAIYSADLTRAHNISRVPVNKSVHESIPAN